ECGRSKFKLLGLPREEFPAVPAVKFDSSWRTSSGDLQKLIGHVAFAASTEERRPILNGVLWELRPERMRMVATNGHRLARMDVPATGRMCEGREEGAPAGADGCAGYRRHVEGSGRPDHSAESAGPDPPALRRQGRAGDRQERKPSGIPLRLDSGIHPAHRGPLSQLRAGNPQGE